MEATEMLGKIQEYLGEQVKICKSISEKASEMSDEENLMHLGKIKALMEFQIFVLNMAVEML